MDEDNPRYKQTKASLEADKKQLQKIEEEIKARPSPKDIHKDIENTTQQILSLSGKKGGTIVGGEDASDTGSDTDTSDVPTTASGDESEGDGLNASWTQPGPDKELYVDPRVSTKVTDPRIIVEKVQADMNKQAEKEGKGSHYYGFSEAVDEALRKGLIYYDEPRKK